MIKFAVSFPSARKTAIRDKINLLDWEHDPFLKNYGLKIEPNMLRTKARILDPPEVMFNRLANERNSVSVKPGTSGTWNLRGRKFLKGNTIPLRRWGVYIHSGGRAV